MHYSCKSIPIHWIGIWTMKIENGWCGRHITNMVLVQLRPYRSLQINTNVFLLIAVILWWNISILMWVVSFKMAISPSIWHEGSPKGFWRRHKLFAIVFTIINTTGLTILDWHLRLCSLQSSEPKLKEYIFYKNIWSLFFKFRNFENIQSWERSCLSFRCFYWLFVYTIMYISVITQITKWQKNMTSFFL